MDYTAALLQESFGTDTASRCILRMCKKLALLWIANDSAELPRRQYCTKTKQNPHKYMSNIATVKRPKVHPPIW